MPAKFGHGGRSRIEIGADEIAPVLGVKARRETRRADEIAEHHRDRTPLSLWRRSLYAAGAFHGASGRTPVFRRSIDRASSGKRGGQRGDGVEQPPPIADRGNAMSLRSSAVSRGSRSVSTLLSRNLSSYWPRPRP